MFNLDQLRRRREQRLSLALESWYEAKEHVKTAHTRPVIEVLVGFQRARRIVDAMRVARALCAVWVC